jgi:molybdate transport system substrate-binding protein
MGTTFGAIPVRLARGESADIVIMARSELDNLAKKGEILEGSQVDLARSRIGIAVRVGTPTPDISTVAALRRTLLQARSAAYSDSASGVYVSSILFKLLGIEKEMRPKSREIRATAVGLVVARGEAEIGFQQMSELLPISGITVVGPIPDEVQKITVFSSGIVTRSKAQDAGRVLIRYLASPASCAAIKQTGLDPIACAADPLAKLHIPRGESMILENAEKTAASVLAELRALNHPAPKAAKTLAATSVDKSPTEKMPAKIIDLSSIGGVYGGRPAIVGEKQLVARQSVSEQMEDLYGEHGGLVRIAPGPPHKE